MSANPTPPSIVIRIGRKRLTLTWRPRKRIASLLVRLLTRMWRAFGVKVTRLAQTTIVAASSGAMAAGPTVPALPGSALPTGGTVAAGSAHITQSGNAMTVYQGSDKAILNWTTFNIGSQSSVHFQQPSANSVAMNRVTSNDPSLLQGALTGTGKVWVINPAGIMVGRGARIDVQGFVASSLQVRDEDFLGGRMNFQATPNAGAVQNFGSITTPSGGSVYLVAPNVENSGVIRAPDGEVILAAGQSVSLVDTATPGVRVEVTGSEGNATNLGTVISEAGRIGMAGVLVKNSGTLNASSAVSEGGRIFLRATKDAVLDQSAQVNTTGATGGHVEVTGERVGVLGNARIDASGTNGGGTVLVGGDWQGANSAVKNAQTAVFAEGASIQANATERGNGGKVVLWSDGVTIAAGSIGATGGAQGGNGGQVETSGKAHLNVDTLRVDTRAARGQQGLLLLDPENITIGTVALFDGGSTGSDIDTVGLSGGAYTLDMGSYVGSNSQITAARLGQLLGSANVVLLASGDITVQNSINKTTGGTQSLSLTAGNNINFDANVTSSSGALNLNATAGNSILGLHTLNLNGGALNMTATAGDISLGQLFAGSIAMTASNGQIIGDSGISWNAGSFNLNAGTRIRGSEGALITVMNGAGNFTAQAGSSGQGGISILTDGAIGNLNLTASGTGGGGQVDFTGYGAIGSATVSAVHNVSVSAQGNLNVASLSSQPNRSVNLAANGGTLTLGAFNDSTADLTLTGANLAISTLTARNIALTGTSGLALNSAVAAGGTLQLNSSGALDVNANVTSVGNMAVSTQGITVGATGQLRNDNPSVNTINANGGTLSNSGYVGGGGNFTLSGASVVNNAGATMFADDSQYLNVSATAGTLTNRGTIHGDLNLTLSGRDGVLNTGASAVIRHVTTNDLSITASQGTITNELGATIENQDGGLLLSGQNISLAGGTLTGTRDISLTATQGSIVLPALGATQNLTVSAQGISQTGALTVGGTSSFSGGNGAIALTNAGNTFTGAVSLNTTGSGDVALRDNGALALAASNLGTGALTLTSGALTQTGAVTQGAGAGDVTLNTGMAQINLSRNDNHLTGTVTLNTGGSANIGNNTDLRLGAATLGSLNAHVAGSISQAGALNLASYNDQTLQVGAGQSIDLSGYQNVLGRLSV
ncbi:MAG: filamentous hemagglutinin N-terminal domain-containing protein, partial [Rhizobacter sp.]